jgi:protein-S-isoprenylcysteine O-methyltransferase Ste14
LSTLPFDDPGARIAFDVVVGAFVLSELTIRLRSERNRAGSRLERTSLQVVQATALAGVGGAVLLTRRLPGAAVAGGRWPLFVAGLVLMCAGIAIRQWRSRRSGASRSTSECSPARRSSRVVRTAGFGTPRTPG